MECNFFGVGRFVIVFLLALVSIKTFGQEHRFVHIDSRQGLSHNFVRAIYKDKTGFVWIGTESGLNRFDGYSIKIYRNDPADSSSLLNDNVIRLFETPDGKLGVVTANGICFYDPATETFSTDFRFLKKFSITNPADLTNIIHDNAGNYWFLLHNNGLACYTERKKNALSVKHIDNDTTTISTNNVTSLIRHIDGSYWIAHGNGDVDNVVFEKEKLIVIKRISFLRNYSTHIDKILQCELTIDNDGDVWGYVTNSDEGVFHYSILEQKLYHLNKNSKATPMSSDLITGITQDNHGNIWISGNGGIDILNKKNLSIKNITDDSENETALSENSTTVMFKDQ